MKSKVGITGKIRSAVQSLKDIILAINQAKQVIFSSTTSVEIDLVLLNCMLSMKFDSFEIHETIYLLLPPKSQKNEPKAFLHEDFQPF
jgi:hypothetical protein